MARDDPAERALKKVEETWDELNALVARERKSNDKPHDAAEVRTLGDILEQLLGPAVIVLHDRRSVEHVLIDNIVVAATGVWVVGVEDYDGKAQRRDGRLFVGKTDRQDLVDSINRQADVVDALLDVEGIRTHRNVCLVDAEWPPLARAFEIDGVSCSWPRRLIKAVNGKGTLGAGDVERIAAHLSDALPPA